MTAFGIELSDFLPMARILLEEGEEAYVVTLAKLLQALSRGQGHLPLDETLGEASLNDLPAHLMEVDGKNILLKRTAAHWKKVRAHAERVRGTSIHSWEDDRIQLELNRLFPPFQLHDEEGKLIFDNSQQRLAAAMLVDTSFGVLTGGPGTGKTTSAAALLSLRRSLDKALLPEHVLVCAPTGKAANRLKQSLAGASKRLSLNPEERAFLEELNPRTLHKALGWGPVPPERGGPFRFGQGSKLEAKLILVDEASMVDVALMAHLIDALPSDASLILLGDRDQLESVEAGGVLAELVRRGASEDLPQELIDRMEKRCTGFTIQDWREGLPPSNEKNALPGIAVGLSWSFRAKDAPWILEMSEMVKPGAASNSEEFIKSIGHLGEKVPFTLHLQKKEFQKICVDQWKRLYEKSRAWSLEALPSSKEIDDLLGEFQLLCGTNFQVSQANRVGLSLAEGDWTGDGPLPHGCPILIDSNQPLLDLANGDQGVLIGREPGEPGVLAMFSGKEEGIPVPSLPSHQPSFGLTIHKSQGSEWKEVSIDISKGEKGLLDRNLLYTAITRSSLRIDLYASELVLEDILDGTSE